jgi:hypothetical protein
MKFRKEVISNLNRCYSIAPLTYKGRGHFLVASEKDYSCLLFDENGRQEQVIWEHPGGTMSMVQLPGSDGVFLATHRFYSPNDSKEAEIVMVSPPLDGFCWRVKTLTRLSHVHRFDILTRNGVNYLIACTLCSGRDYKDDWSYPGKVYGTVLPENLNKLEGDIPIELSVIKDNMLKNHGYLRHNENGVMCGIAACESGVYRFTPPEKKGRDWEIIPILNVPVSDLAMVDLDGDGEDEMVAIAPFHGDELRIYKKIDGEYRVVYTHPAPVEFAHAIWGGNLCGKPVALIGHRQGKQELFYIHCSRFDPLQFETQVIDSGVGPANVCHSSINGEEVLISANREISEVALYHAIR